LGGLLGKLSGALAGGGVGGLLSGGLSELLDRFKENGQGDVADSWVSKGPNKELPAPRLKQAIGADVLAALAQQTGLREEELQARLKSFLLPLISIRRTDAFRIEFRNYRRGFDMGIIWTILIGFVAGVIAKFIMPGANEPAGFILTAVLGIVGAFVATFLGQGLGWYRPGEGAGLIGAIVGAVIVLFVYSFLAGRRRAV